MERTFIAAALLATALTPAFAQTPVSMDEVPAAVMETAIETAPGIDFVSVSTEIENGVTVYEFQGVAYDGRRIEVDVLADGSLQEIEMEETEGDLPAAVVATIEDLQPEGIILLVETTVDGDGFSYEVEVETEQGTLVAYEISETGELLSTDEGALS